MKCRFCGNEVPDVSKFCPFCGGSQQSAPIDTADLDDNAFAADNTQGQSEPHVSEVNTYSAPTQNTYVAPAQNVYTAPNYAAYPPPKKSSKGLIITLSVIGGVILIAAVVVLLLEFGVLGKPVEHSAKPSESATDTLLPETTTDADTTEAEPEVTTDAPTVSPYFEDARIYVHTSADTDPYNPCVEFYPTGEFIFTENLLAGIGKVRGTYAIDGNKITLDVVTSYNSSILGSDVRQIVFYVADDALVINTNLCYTCSGHRFTLDNGYVPPEEMIAEEEHGMEYPDEATHILDASEVRYVNVGRTPQGSPYTLFMRTAPNTADANNRICGLVHGTAVEVFAYNSDGSWAWVFYEGNANDLSGASTRISRFGWCSTEFLSDHFPN